MEAGKFEVWRASLRLGGVLEERVTACHGVSGGGQLPAHVRYTVTFLGYERVTSVSPPPSRVACAMIIHVSPTPQLDPLW